MVRVAVAQVRIDADDVAGNLGGVRAAFLEAREQGADLVVLPELAVSGYVLTPTEAAERAEEPGGATERLLVELTAERGGVVVCGYAERGADGRVHNAALVVDGGAVLGRYRKVHLWGGESDLFVPGDQPPLVLDTSAGRVAVMVCYDLEMPEWVRMAADAGAEIVAAPVNWPRGTRPPGERPLEVAKVQAAAGTYRVHVAVADRCGLERGQQWEGGSVIVDADGYPVAGPLSDGQEVAAEGLLVATLDPAAARSKALGPFNDVRRDRRPGLYRESERPEDR